MWCPRAAAAPRRSQGAHDCELVPHRRVQRPPVLLPLPHLRPRQATTTCSSVDPNPTKNPPSLKTCSSYMLATGAAAG